MRALVLALALAQHSAASRHSDALPAGAGGRGALVPAASRGAVPTRAGRSRGSLEAGGRGGGGLEASGGDRRAEGVRRGRCGSRVAIPGRGGLLGVGGRGRLCDGLLHLLRVAVEEEVHGHVPLLRAGDGAAQAQHLACQQPVQQANRELALVVGGDGHVHVAQRRVRVAEGDHRDVDVRRLAHGLVVDARVRHQQQARLLEVLGDLVREGAGGEAAGDRLGARVVRELEHSTLRVGARADGDHVLRVLDGHDDTGRQLDLLPGLGHVQDVHAVGAAAEDVGRHLEVSVARAHVGLGGQQLADVILTRCEVRHGAC
mmetsp:Transcript_79753/g.221839  ORF Transcript_79753/g.221839 Transcript_79753/m.221839 type:complete len:316 (-) Transcript_79753:36-983(-)